MNLNRLMYFAAVVDTRSFTRAAKHLGVTKAVVSQHVSLLEQELRATLLMRTTRKVQPTEAGQMLYAHCVNIRREAERAFDELAVASTDPVGVLRLTAPNDYGSEIVVPVVAAFIGCYPACSVDLALGDEAVDLMSSDFDLAVRVGWLPDSSLQARKIGEFRQLLVGAPALVERYPRTSHPRDIFGFPMVANNALRDPLVWKFSQKGRPSVSVRMKSSVSVNTTPGVLAAVRAGAGVSVLPDFAVREDLNQGRLAHLLSSWDLPSGGIFAVYPNARFRPPKVTKFVDMLIDAAHGPLNLGSKERSAAVRGNRRKRAPSRGAGSSQRARAGTVAGSS